MRRVNGWLTIFWVLMIPLSIVTHWIGSVTNVAALSLWALVFSHWSARQAALVEVKQDQEQPSPHARKNGQPAPGTVLEEIPQD